MIIAKGVPAASSMGLLAEFFEVPYYGAVIGVFSIGYSIKPLGGRISILQ